LSMSTGYFRTQRLGLLTVGVATATFTPMDLSRYLETAPPGTRARLAKRVGIAPTYLYQIETGRRPAPVGRILALAEAAEWEVTPHEIRPDLYPHPEDGMPPELRGLSKEERAA